MSFQKDFRELKINPFKMFYPSKMTPELFWSLICEEYSWINKVRERNDLFIKGSRGSGKSTLLYYYKLDFLIERFENLTRFLDPKINKDFKVIGIYFDGKKDFQQGNSEYTTNPKEDNRIKKIKESWGSLDLFINLVLKLLDEILENFKELLDQNKLSKNIKSRLINFVSSCLKIPDVKKLKKKSNIFTFYEELSNILLEKQRKNLDLIVDIFVNGLSRIEYKVFSINIQDIKKLIFILKDLIPEIKDYSFYFLIDDGDRLNKTFQQFLNLLIKPRDHNNYCLKIVLEKGWETWSFPLRVEDHIQFPHDYDIIDLDELYTNNLGIFTKQIKKICEKRFQLLKRDFDFEKFFPYSETQIRNREVEKKKMFSELLKERYNLDIEVFNSLALIKKREIELVIGNLINKYLNVKLFRNYKKKHTKIPYSGYDNIIYLSSGNIRDFLACTTKMYETAGRESDFAIIEKISPSIQSKVIDNESEKKINHLEEDISVQEDENERNIYIKLRNLVLNLGFFFKRRFYFSKLKDVRLFSFVIKDYDRMTPTLRKIFQIGIRENLFHEFYKSTKDGNRRVKGYTLHRLLLPFFSLDPSSLRGRIEFTCQKLERFTLNKIDITTIDRFLTGD